MKSGYLPSRPMFDYNRLWLRGRYEPSYFASSAEESYKWRLAYTTHFLERDLRCKGFLKISIGLARKIWTILAHDHGTTLNFSKIGFCLEVSHHTVRFYVNILKDNGMVRILEPWFENVGKRQVKTPKIYIRDSGLLHTLLGIQDNDTLQVYPRLGASWEGFALEEVIKINHATTEECFFWGVQSGAELDLLIIKNGKRIGFEIKYTDTPKLTKSMVVAMQDLKLDHLYVVYPHKVSYPLADTISVVGIEELKAVF